VLHRIPFSVGSATPTTAAGPEWMVVRTCGDARHDRAGRARRKGAEPGDAGEAVAAGAHVMPAREAIGHLAGMQAQAPLAPYVGLQARIAGLRPCQLADLLTERAVVRAHLMRNTAHLVKATDYAGFRPLFQQLMERGLTGNFGRNLVGVDRAELKAAAAALLSRRPLTRTQLARERRAVAGGLGHRHPGRAGHPDHQAIRDARRYRRDRGARRSAAGIRGRGRRGARHPDRGPRLKDHAQSWPPGPTMAARDLR